MLDLFKYVEIDIRDFEECMKNIISEVHVYD